MKKKVIEHLSPQVSFNFPGYILVPRMLARGQYSKKIQGLTEWMDKLFEVVIIFSPFYR